MKITRISDTEFLFLCEDEEEVQPMRCLKQFVFEENVYLVKRVVPGLTVEDYESYFVHIYPPL